jgi:hypothetical protein
MKRPQKKTRSAPSLIRYEQKRMPLIYATGARFNLTIELDTGKKMHFEGYVRKLDLVEEIHELNSEHPLVRALPKWLPGLPESPTIESVLLLSKPPSVGSTKAGKAGFPKRRRISQTKRS